MMKKSTILILVSLLVIFIVGALSYSEFFSKPKYDYLVLVNKENKLPDDWEENVELVTMKNVWDEEIQVEKNAYNQFLKLQAALEKEGVHIALESAYRSVQAQQDLWDAWTEEYGIDYVKKFVAVPGYSEHHTGLALDVVLIKDGEIIYDNDEMIAEVELFAKVHEKLPGYGFILRYPKGKEDISGCAYEPWHLRFINDINLAKKLTSQGLTLEEYLLK